MASQKTALLCPIFEKNFLFILYQMQGSIVCNFFTPISILPLYAVYFILIYCFYDFDFTCGLESLSEYSKELYNF